LGAPAKVHLIGDLGAIDLPWVTEAQPFVGNLGLPAILDHLVKNAELVANAISDCGHFERGERVHETRREPAEPGLLLDLEQLLEILSELRERLSRRPCNAEVQQIVSEMRAGKKFDGEVGDNTGVALVEVLDGLHRMILQPVVSASAR
jgi:hypothetical protein